MPRGKKREWKEQVYDLGDGVTVTVRYAADARPKMLHDDQIVIIGEHVCAQQQMVLHDPGYSAALPAPGRGGNFEIDPRQHPLFGKFGPGGAAPPDYSPPVLTSEQLFAGAGMALAPGALSTAALEEMDANHPRTIVDEPDA
jgi:hypothetical protein